MISQETIQAVKDRVSIVEIVSEVTALKRQGSSFVGLCPFHTEKSPSFNVRDDSGFYHCFGCGVSGGVIDFVMRMRGLSFPEAVEDLATRFGIEIKREGAKKAPSQDRNGALKINALAHEFFRQMLKQHTAVIKPYLTARGLTDEAIKVFSIGFAPLEWRALKDFLQQRKGAEQLAARFGLLKRNSQGELYDVFRGRVIFPITEDGRRILGFGGRLVPNLSEDDKAPKYLNSSETPAYQKSKVMFGLPQAQQAIRECGFIYLVEGYMDVVGLWQAGVKNVLATCGTAVTELHIKRLARLSSRIVILFDGDDAGRRAAGKTFPIFLNSGVDVSAVFLPQGEDPDSIAKMKGEETSKFLSSAPQVTLLECFINNLCEKFGAIAIESLGAASKGQLCVELCKSLALVKNVVERGMLLERAALRLKVRTQELESLMKGHSPIKPQLKEVSVTATQTLVATSIMQLPKLDREILLCVMGQRELAHGVLQNPDICSAITPVTLHFIEGLISVMSTANDKSEETKEQLKAFLVSFGESWVQHWRRAHAMLSDKTVKLSLVFDECLKSVQKGKLNQTVKALEREMLTATDEQHKVRLAEEQVALRRRAANL